jgi:hypothetical protein
MLKNVILTDVSFVENYARLLLDCLTLKNRGLPKQLSKLLV